MKRRDFIVSSLATPFVISSFPKNAEASNFLAGTFLKSIKSVNGNIVQDYRSSGQTAESFQKMRNSCGLLCMLAIYNYFDYRDYKTNPGFTQSKSKVEDAAYRLYEFIGRDGRTYYQSIQDMDNIASNRWSWGTHIIRSTSVSYSYSGLQGDLRKNRPVITLMKANSNPAFYNIDHFIVSLLAGEDKVIYFDPFIGKVKAIDRRGFENSWVGSKIGLALGK